jgi:hypothetical protein
MGTVIPSFLTFPSSTGIKLFFSTGIRNENLSGTDIKKAARLGDFFYKHLKADQIRASGAKIVICPCHNCYDQVRDLGKEYDLGIKLMSFKEIFEEILYIPEELKTKEEDEEADEGIVRSSEC